MEMTSSSVKLKLAGLAACVVECREQPNRVKSSSYSKCSVKGFQVSD